MGTHVSGLLTSCVLRDGQQYIAKKQLQSDSIVREATWNAAECKMISSANLFDLIGERQLA